MNFYVPLITKQEWQKNLPGILVQDFKAMVMSTGMYKSSFNVLRTLGIVKSHDEQFENSCYK